MTNAVEEREEAPLILVTPATEKKGPELADLSLSLAECYARALIAAGGLPWVLSCTPDREFIAACVARCDGIMLTGGEDIQPGLHSPTAPAALVGKVKQTEPERDLFELLVIEEVFRQRKPLFGICRGHQLVNVAMGGDLVIDLPSEQPQALNHRRIDRKCELVHEVALAPGSEAARIFGRTQIRVNSTHHQAVKRLAPLFQTVGTSPDGVVEAMELAEPSRDLLPWFLSVQFHPERLYLAHADFLSLFTAFVAACAADAVNQRRAAA